MIRVDKLIRAKDIQKALNESCSGKSGRYVYAMNSKMEWTRIYQVKTHRGAVYGKALYNQDRFGEWFVIHQWEER